MTPSGISYLDEVWNVYTFHCHPTSPGCANCYAMARVKGWGGDFIGNPGLLTGAKERFDRLPSNRVVGINFMSDTWHESVPLAWIERIHDRVAERPQNVFLYTTKRAERLAANAHRLHWPKNLWVGVSVESQRFVSRIHALRQVPTDNRWVSFEPLLENVGEPKLTGIRWVVVGGESGERRRYFDKAWAATLRDWCIRLSIPFYFKQGSHEHPDNDRALQGRTWDDVPAAFTAIRKVEPTPEQGRLF